MDEEVEACEHGLDSILTDSVSTPELDVSFGEADNMSASEFLCLVSTISNNSSLQLAPSVKSPKLRCHTRTLTVPALQAGKF